MSHFLAVLNPLFAILTDQLLNISKQSTLSPLPATLTDIAPVTPLFASLTKNRGGRGYPPIFCLASQIVTPAAYPAPLPQRFHIRSIHIHGHRPLDQFERHDYPKTVPSLLQDA